MKKAPCDGGVKQGLDGASRGAKALARRRQWLCAARHKDSRSIRQKPFAKSLKPVRAEPVEALRGASTSSA
jgi:hypothetical protein